jgi:hypothetical protein
MNSPHQNPYAPEPAPSLVLVFVFVAFLITMLSAF